ncbi:hypothetical protein [Isoptericola aurantiacus]|uniref:hypothetical protein n=1 Tax=Isoptericola aurantiacus TaxID=3377839 RepID=UPI00383BD273
MSLCLARPRYPVPGLDAIACQLDADGHEWHEALIGTDRIATWRDQAPPEITPRTET